MKRIFVILLISALCSSCVNDRNKIFGDVFRNDFGVYTEASGATVKITNTLNLRTIIMTADSSGHYEFTDVADGYWTLYAEYSDSTFSYSGSGGEIHVNGKDKKEADITVQ